MAELNLDALRGAYVSLAKISNQHFNRARALREEADQAEASAKDYRDMAEAASKAFVAQGGDPKDAQNWYSWTYLGTNKPAERFT